jgi:DNA-binding transcriptional LysR family regulator
LDLYLSAMHLKEIDANLLIVLDALLVDASVSHAAERLGRSASAISHALAKLREIFADELFVRAGQRLVPTAKARELAPTVHVLLAGMESLLRETKPFDPSNADREFFVAANEVAELTLLQPLRKRLETVAPNIKLGWVPARLEDSLEDLRGGTAHFVVEMGSQPNPPADVYVKPLFDDPLITLGRKGHRLGAAKGKSKSDAFIEAEHIAVNSVPAFNLIEPLLGANRASTSAARVSSVMVGLLLALNSDALLTLPASVARVLEQQFVLLRVTQPWPEIKVPVKLQWHASYERDECHRWLREQLVALAQEVATRSA